MPWCPSHPNINLKYFGIHNSHSLRVMNSFLQNIALGTMTDTAHAYHYSLAFLGKQK